MCTKARVGSCVEANKIYAGRGFLNVAHVLWWHLRAAFPQKSVECGWATWLLCFSLSLFYVRCLLRTVLESPGNPTYYNKCHEECSALITVIFLPGHQYFICHIRGDHSPRREPPVTLLLSARATDSTFTVFASMVFQTPCKRRLP